MNSRDSETIRELLAMSMAMLAMQQQINALRTQVEQMRAAKPDYMGTATKLLGLLISTRTGQAIVGFALSAAAGIARHFLGDKWCSSLLGTGFC